VFSVKQTRNSGLRRMHLAGGLRTVTQLPTLKKKTWEGNRQRLKKFMVGGDTG